MTCETQEERTRKIDEQYVLWSPLIAEKVHWDFPPYMNVIFPEKLMNLVPMWWGKEIGEGITSRMDILLSQLFLPPRSGNIIFYPFPCSTRIVSMIEKVKTEIVTLRHFLHNSRLEVLLCYLICVATTSTKTVFGTPQRLEPEGPEGRETAGGGEDEEEARETGQLFCESGFAREERKRIIVSKWQK